MSIVLKKKTLFGREKVTRIDERAIEIEGKTYPLSQIIFVRRQTDGNTISFVSVDEQLDHALLERIVERLACERPLADERGNWLVLQSQIEFSSLFRKVFGNEYGCSSEFFSYDWQQDEGQKAYDLIYQGSRASEVKSIYDELRKTNPTVHWGSKGEMRKQCKTCGATYCYTAEDFKRLARDARANVHASLLQVGGALTGNFGASIYGKQKERKVVDLNRCPYCDSPDIVDLDPNTNQSQPVPNDGAGHVVSAADEILKFKNLADQGIITLEEFEAKKRQLLGL